MSVTETPVRRSKYGPAPKDPLLTIASNIEIDDETCCWNWTAALDNGYGAFTPPHREGGRYSFRAHRSLYERVVEDVDPDLHLDHLCRNRRCVNPDHLEPVTAAENNRRIPRSPYCPKGHEYTEENTRYHKSDGSRYCLECVRLKSRRFYAKYKAEGRPWNAQQREKARLGITRDLRFKA